MFHVMLGLAASATKMVEKRVIETLSLPSDGSRLPLSDFSKMVGARGIEPPREFVHLLPKQDRCQITDLHPD